MCFSNPVTERYISTAALECARGYDGLFVRHQSFMGTGASASLGLADGENSGAPSFDPEAGASSAAGTSWASTGAMASVNAFAGSIGADSDAGATSDAGSFNLVASRGSSAGRGRGNGGDEAVRWC